MHDNQKKIKNYGKEAAKIEKFNPILCINLVGSPIYHKALLCLERIFREGFKYVKAGVLITDIKPEDQVQKLKLMKALFKWRIKKGRLGRAFCPGSYTRVTAMDYEIQSKICSSRIR